MFCNAHPDDGEKPFKNIIYGCQLNEIDILLENCGLSFCQTAVMPRSDHCLSFLMQRGLEPSALCMERQLWPLSYSNQRSSLLSTHYFLNSLDQYNLILHDVFLHIFYNKGFAEEKPVQNKVIEMNEVLSKQ